MKQSLLIFLFFLFIIGRSQNLVLNPDFELYHCDKWYISSIEDCDNWTSPTMTSPDYFNNSCLENGTSAIPQKYWGHQLPKSGKSYMGIIAYDYRKQNSEEAGAEYIQGSLSETLKANQKYIIQFYVSLAECSKLALKNIGFYFSDKKTKEKTLELLKLNPQIITNINLSDTSKWIAINETYIATGKENYFIIGCFNNGKKVKFNKVNPAKYIPDPRGYAYYYVDNVIIKPEKEDQIVKTEIQKTPKDTIKIISQVTKLEVGSSFILNNISFTTGSYELTEFSFKELDKIVELLNKNPNITILISGHTDNIGDKYDNLNLSKQRAESVLNYIVSKGINKTRTAYDGYGDTLPIANNDEDEGRKKNRRVEVTITKK
jgi:OmpA-OmpF porin, OOP family